MKDIYDKISKIIGDLIVYCNVSSISDLCYFKDKVTFIIKDKNNTSKPVEISYSELVKLHDYKLEQYIVTLFIDNG